ncbi:MAG TPA: SGNH/GDSL hydrolase family protein [Gemmatimonadaceae bacterium]|nr:SGNH/GDSL hydrolase family protein [Gemmatimonadaceae bacterium]
MVIALAVAGEVLLRIAPGLSPEARARERLNRLHPTWTPVINVIKAQEVAAPTTYKPVPPIGAVMSPLQHDTVRTPDYTFVRETDHAGFTNHDPWPARVDVAVLGSSLVTGPGVGVDGQFSTLLERRFPGHAVLNLGIPGGGSELEVRAESLYAEAYHPAVVLLAIWVASDVDNSRTFAHWEGEKSPQGFSEYRFDFYRTHPDTVVHGAVSRLLNASALWRAAWTTTRAVLARAPMRERVAFDNGDTIYLSVRLQHRLAEGMHRADTPDLRDVMLDPLQRLQHRVEARGGHFAVVLLPSKEEIYGAQAFPPVLRTAREVRAALHARRIPVVDLYDDFRRLDRREPAFYPTDIHYTALGNQVIADAIARWMESVWPEGAR